MIYAISAILIPVAVAYLWACESCRRQQAKYNLEDRGIFEGPEYEKSSTSFFS